MRALSVGRRLSAERSYSKMCWSVTRCRLESGSSAASICQPFLGLAEHNQVPDLFEAYNRQHAPANFRAC